MANEDHLRYLKQGIPMWNQWRRQNPLVQPDLSAAVLHQANLSRGDFTGANLRMANLSFANLTEAYLGTADLNRADFRNAYLIRTDVTRADLREADLSSVNGSGAHFNGADLSSANLNGALLERAHLINADLSQVDCRGANLTEADLSRADLSGADLTGANIDGCTMGWTKLAHIDLRHVEGLETVRHRGPSTIGIDTIYSSQAAIPEIFLRGAGIPENFITYMHSLAGTSFEYYSCFISYSSKDQELAERLYADLQNKGVRCWFAPEDLRIGDRLRPVFDEAIRLHDKLMLLLSENSVKSPWVEKEVETAFEKERQQGRTVLFPIRLDDTVMATNQAWAADIRRTRHIGDFQGWKSHDSYIKAFERLIRDLKAGQS